MKPACGVLLIVFLLSVRFSYGQGENNTVLDQKISLEAHQESLASILEKIAQEASVYFSYDPLLIKADKKIDASLTSKSIREVLEVLLEGKFTYSLLDNQVVITTPETLQDSLKRDSLLVSQHPMITFRGKVVDYHEKESLPFASISLRKASLGTISNTDGEFVLKIPGFLLRDTVVISCLGYRQFRKAVADIREDASVIYLQPANFQLQEIKVVYINPQEILRRVHSKIEVNYPDKPEIMTSFYREVLRQDNDYIDVAEAVMDISKASYDNEYAEDKVKFIKGRKGINVKPFQKGDFKIQGWPYYITRLDVVKTLDTFLDPEYAAFYKFDLDEVIEYDGRSTFVISFKPKDKGNDVYYQGKIYVDRSTFALVKAEFELSRNGLKEAAHQLIQKKSKGLIVKPLKVMYQVNYRRSDVQWHLSYAMASISFKVKSKTDKVNSDFHSVSELLVTDFKAEEGIRFKRNEVFSSQDIFTEMVSDDDDHFWDDYNIIMPTEELRDALKKYQLENDTLFSTRK